MDESQASKVRVGARLFYERSDSYKVTVEVLKPLDSEGTLLVEVYDLPQEKQIPPFKNGLRFHAPIYKLSLG